MAPRKDPASAVVDFFTTAPIETAQTVLAIARNIVAKRAPKRPASRKPSTANSQPPAAQS
jgi:hypothetical protein